MNPELKFILCLAAGVFVIFSLVMVIISIVAGWMDSPAVVEDGSSPKPVEFPLHQCVYCNDPITPGIECVYVGSKGFMHPGCAAYEGHETTTT